MSIIWEPGENFLLCKSNAGNSLLNLLFISTTKPLIISHWWEESKSNEKQWGSLYSDVLDLSSDHRIWLWESEWALSWALPLSLQRYRWIEIRPAITSILNEGEVWKMPRFQIAALFCIFFNSLRGYDKDALLWNYS